MKWVHFLKRTPGSWRGGLMCIRCVWRAAAHRMTLSAALHEVWIYMMFSGSDLQSCTWFVIVSICGPARKLQTAPQRRAGQIFLPTLYFQTHLQN